jgi:hypothetical protein
MMSFIFIVIKQASIAKPSTTITGRARGGAKKRKTHTATEPARAVTQATEPSQNSNL